MPPLLTAKVSAMTISETTGIVALDARRGLFRARRDASAQVRMRDSRVHRMLKRAEETTARDALLMRECDHRIKNSLQIVASVLHLKARRAATPEVAVALNAAAAQVRAISHIHDVLQLTGQTDAVDLGAVLTDLCKSLQAMTGDSRTISIDGADEKIETPVALTQPVVLAVSELITNALRHAFGEGREGKVHLSVERLDGKLRLVVSDNGRGLPEGYADGIGYGMQLVRGMVAQIEGELHAENDDGAKFTITAPY